MYTIVEFDDNNKWFVISEKEINNIKYSYLIRVNSAEDDFIDEEPKVVEHKKIEKTAVVEDNNDELEEGDLFNLIDSMYEKRDE